MQDKNKNKSEQEVTQEVTQEVSRDVNDKVDENKKEIIQNPKFKLIKIPKQDFRTNRLAVRPFLDDDIVKELKEVFDLFSTTDKVNPHDIKNDFHKESPHIYKIIEELCLNFDMNGTAITFEQFVNFLNGRLGDSTNRQGIQKVYQKLIDTKEKEITPESLHKMITELGDRLTLEEVTYILETVSEPSLDINISSDEFYYIMTKKPADVDLITPIAKSTK